MINKSRIDLFLTVGLLFLISVHLTGCFPVPTPIVTIVPITTNTPDPSLFPVFPGAEGFGAMTVGGRGGEVIEVTNLDNSGPGSLRAALSAAGKRMIVFRVAGTIGLESSLVIENPYITIAGQTAPGQGITLRGIKPEVEALILIKTSRCCDPLSLIACRSAVSG